MKTAPKPTTKKVTSKISKPIVKAAAKTTVKAAVKPVVKTLSKPVVTATSKTASKPVTAAKTTATVVKPLIEKPIKAKKVKLVRDSFTIPKPEYLILDNLKLRAANFKHPVKKSELIRAGIKALFAMTDSNLIAALKVVPVLKSGRPGK